MKFNNSRYLILFGVGFRLWYNPKYWGFHWYNDNNKVAIGLGPLEIYYDKK